MSRTFNLFDISRYRTQLMGVASIMILFCHASPYGVEMPHSLRVLFGFGNLGVDIFLLLSGLGCYYSLTNIRGSLKDWYIKRFLRILVPYTYIQIPFVLCYLCVGLFDFYDYFYVFSTLAFWTEHRGAWYVALLIPLYLFTPLIYSLNCSKYRILYFSLIGVVLLVICHYNFVIENGTLKNIVCNCQWAFKRCISFLIGMLMAPAIKQRCSVSVSLIVYCLLVYLVCYYFFRNLFLGWILVPVFIYVYVYVLKLFMNCVLYKFITWIGKISLESYLANIYLCSLFKNFSCIGILSFNEPALEYLFIVVTGLVLSYVTNLLSMKTKNIVL